MQKPKPFELKDSGNSLFIIAFLFLSIILEIPFHGLCQSVNPLPLIRNFNKQQYKGGTQTWDIETDSNGLVYFANNDGLLLFNGSGFQKFSLPKGTIMRSVLADSENGRIYVGGQNEIGFFEPNTKGFLKYTNLDSLLPPNLKGFEDVWDIFRYGKSLFFLTSRQLIIYENNAFRSMRFGETDLDHLFLLDNRLYLSTSNGELRIFNNESFELLVKVPDAITGLIDLGNNELAICTYKSGVFRYNGKQLTGFGNLVNSRIYKALPYKNYILLATSRQGLIILNKQGDWLGQIGIGQGLQNNNILSICIDRFDNLWLGLDNGIDLVRLDFPFAYLKPDGILKGTGYAMASAGGIQYFGTNNGLYAREIGNTDPEKFRLVSGTEGQVWWVQTIKDQIYISHHEGLFKVTGFTANKIANIKGCWKLIALKTKPGYYAAGTYSGIKIFSESAGVLRLTSTLEGFQESTRFLEEDTGGDIWVGHPYKGIYKLKINEELTRVSKVQRFGKANGLPSEDGNYVFSTEDGIMFATPVGVYRFDALKRRFVIEPEFRQSIAYKRIIQGKQGRLWYITQQGIFCKMPVYNGVDYSVSILKVPQLDQPLVGGFEYLKEEENGNVFLGTENGFVQFSLKKLGTYKPGLPLTWITSVQNLNYPDSFVCFLPGIYSKSIISKEKDLIVNFSAPNVAAYKELSYSSYLEGWDKDWTPWKTNNFRELGRLGFGTYTLKVKTKSMGIEGPETSIKLVIEAPWYLNMYAKIFYALLVVLALITLGFYPQMLVRKKTSRIIKEKDSLHRQQTQQLILEKEKQERELIELRNQQLQKEVEHQGRELASSTMHIMQKSEMLLSIKDKLKRIAQYSNDPKIKPEIQDLIKTIEKDTLIDKDWEKFERYFNHIHDRYTLILKEKYPILTANDIKMCAYLRMNLSTKEIASLLNISTRGVEISRYRLRKKMGLDSGVNLSDYLTSIHP